MIEKLLKRGLIMCSMLVGCLLLVTVVFANGQPGLPNESEAGQFETRCGWLTNPTPANVWLYDRTGEWIIGLQGGHQTKGDWGSEFGRRQWVVQGDVGNYGYGCACMRLRVNKVTREVIEIKSTRWRPLSACRRDPSLKKWKNKFK
jgi:Protein of unknown function (DUF4087)